MRRWLVRYVNAIFFGWGQYLWLLVPTSSQVLIPHVHVLSSIVLSCLFFLCISMIISILEQSSCCQLKILYTTLQETNLHKHQKNNHKPVGFFFNLITRIRNEKIELLHCMKIPQIHMSKMMPALYLYIHMFIFIYVYKLYQRVLSYRSVAPCLKKIG